MAIRLKKGVKLTLGNSVLVSSGYVSSGSLPPLTPGNFYFYLSSPSTASAAVYDSSDNLLRTLWDSVPYSASGTYVHNWNQLDNYGNTITGSYGTDYVIKVGSHNISSSWQGAMVGNTSTVASGPTKLRSFSPMVGGMLAGKKLYLATAYAEGISAAKRIDMNAKGLKANDILDDADTGYNGQNTQFLTTDGTIVYFGGFDPYAAANSFTYGVYVRNDLEVPFSSGVPYTCAIGREYAWALNLQTGSSTDYTTGIAVSDTYLYIARGNDNKIAILDKTTGALVTTNSSSINPRSICISGDRMVMISGSLGSGSVVVSTLSGTSITPTTTLTGLVNPINLSVTPSKFAYYYQSSASTAASGYFMSETWRPFGTEVSSSAIVSANTTEFLVEEFITDYIGITSVPAATWNFNTYAKTTNNAADTELVYRVYKRTSGGAETQLFTVSSTGGFTSNNVYQLKSTASTQSAFAIGETDVIVVKIYASKTTGTSATITVAYDGATNQSNFNITPTNRYIYVIDAGTSQQVKKYTIAGVSVSSHGDAGGYANGPIVTNSKFYFEDSVTGLYNSSDFTRAFMFPMMDESYWVMDIGCFRLQHYDSAQTYIERISWLPNSYSVEGVQNNPTRVFNAYLEYDVPLDNPSNWTLQYNWRWNVTADYFNTALLINVLKNTLTYSNGQTYSTLQNPTLSEYEFVRLDTTSGLVYTGAKTDISTKIWIDVNGNQYKIVTSGAYEGSTFYWQKKSFTGFSALVPQWGAWTTIANAPTIPLNTTTGEPTWDGYFSAPIKTDSDKMFLYNTGYTNKGRHIGLVKTGSSTFSALMMPSTYRTTGSDVYGAREEYNGPYPTVGAYFDIGNNVEYAGSDGFAAGNYLLAPYKGEFWQNTQTNENHLFHENGMQALIFGTTLQVAEGVAGYDQALPAMAGNMFSGLFVQSGSSLYYRHNDESYHSGVHCWKISNINSFVTQSATLGGTVIADTGVNLLANLPYRSVVSSTGSITKNPNTNYFTDFDNNWGVYSGRNSYLPNTNDVWVRFRSNTNLNATVDFGITPSVTNEFTIKGDVIFKGDIHWDDLVGVYIQVLDNSDKVIADMTHSRDLAAPVPNYIEGNGQTILTFNSNFRTQYTTQYKIRYDTVRFDTTRYDTIR